MILHVLCIHILLLAQLRQQHAQLIRDVRDGVVLGRLAPFGELRGDGDALAAGDFVGADGVAFGFDETAHFTAHFGLLEALEGAHAEFEAATAAGVAL